MKSTIVVSEEMQTVHAIDPKTSKKVAIGHVISRVYEGEKVQRHEFSPDPNTEHLMANRSSFKPDRTYNLGPTSTKFQFVDHAAAIQPLLDKGFRIQQQALGKGGISMVSTLIPEKPVEINDPIRWDDQSWNLKQNQKITETVIVTTSVKPGKAVNYRRGWFRQVCTNGLVAEILGLGSIRMNHLQFDPEKLIGTILTQGEALTGHRSAKEALGPVVGNLAGLKRMNGLLKTLAEVVATDTNDDEDSEEITEQPIEVTQLPLFAREAVAPFVAQTNWYRQSLSDQFEQMVKYFTKHSAEHIHALDIVNAVTSPINISSRETGEMAFRPLMKTPALVRATTQLLGAYSLI